MSTAAAPRDASKAALLILFSTVFLNLVGFGLVVPMLPFFGRSLDADPWQITLLFAAYSLGQLFAEPLWGRLSDRIGRKPVLIATTALNALGYLALAFAPTIWWALAIRVLTGLGAGNVSAIQGYVADVTPPERRAGRMGLLGAAFGFGFIAGPALGGFLVQPELGRFGYQIPLFAASALAACASIGVILFVKESRRRADPAAARPKFLSGVSDARANPVVSRVILVMFVYAAAFSGMESSFALWAEDKYGWGPREVAFAFTVVGLVAATAQALFTGRLARRFGEARVLAGGLLLFGASLLVQTLNPFEVLTYPIMAAGAFGMSLAMPNISALISRSSAPDIQGAMLGLNMAAGSAARIMGPIAAGVLFSHAGPDAPYLLAFLLTLPAAWMAIGAGRAFRAKAAGG
jgi:MFS family permease